MSKNFVHRILLEKRIKIVENLTSLTKIKQKRILFAAAPLKLAFTRDNSLVRAFALVLKN